MVFLATFFPTSEDDDDFLIDKEIPFDALTILVAGVGWAFADFLLTRVIF